MRDRIRRRFALLWVQARRGMKKRVPGKPVIERLLELELDPLERAHFSASVDRPIEELTDAELGRGRYASSMPAPECVIAPLRAHHRRAGARGRPERARGAQPEPRRRRDARGGARRRRPSGAAGRHRRPRGLPARRSRGVRAEVGAPVIGRAVSSHLRCKTPQHFLYFLPLPQAQRAFGPGVFLGLSTTFGACPWDTLSMHWLIIVRSPSSVMVPLGLLN